MISFRRKPQTTLRNLKIVLIIHIYIHTPWCRETESHVNLPHRVCYTQLSPWMLTPCNKYKFQPLNFKPLK